VDVLIVGGGPAGLSAALVLGRCCRRVVLCDDGNPRNAPSRALHGYLGSKEVPPKKFLENSRAQLKPYNVTLLNVKVEKIGQSGKLFSIHLASGRKVKARKVLLATGLRDLLPDLKGIERFYGKSIFVCPYCDGWEVRGRALGVFGRGKRGMNLSLTMRGWSKNVTLFGGGSGRLSRSDQERLAAHRIRYYPQKILACEGKGTRLNQLRLEGSLIVPCDALFLNMQSCQKSPLFQKIRGRLDRHRGIDTRRFQVVHRPGIYAAGNALRDVQLAIVAAAEGASAAFEINCALLREDQSFAPQKRS